MVKLKYGIWPLLAALAAGAAFAQSEDNEEQTRAERLRQSLKERAVRIPARDLAAALAASRDARSDRARLVERRPDVAAIREELRQSSQADEENQRTAPLQERSREVTQTAPPLPPPPGIRAFAATRLASAKAEEIDRVFAPVLLPADPFVRDKLKVYGMRNVYTASGELDSEASFSMSGTCNRVVGGDPDMVAFRKRLAESPQRLTRAGAQYHISRNDFGVDLSFSKFGCGYVMTIECGDPANDARCAMDDYITGLADSLILANPQIAEDGDE